MSTDVFQINPERSFDVNGAVPARRGGRTKRTYRCRHCARLFKRSEHCARHERVHTQEKPFPCAFCERRYARKDLVKRHERTLHQELYRKAHPEEFGARSVQENSLSGEDENTESSTTTHRPGSPLTPPNDLPHLTQVIDSDSAFRQAVQTPSGFSPPPSANPGSFGSHGLLMSAPTGSECFAIDMGFHSPQLTSLATPYALGLEEPVFGSPSKRRRLEIDPLLMEPASAGIVMDHLPVHPAVHTSPFEAIDPALENMHLASAPDRRHSFESDAGSMPLWDLSADCSAYFESDLSLAASSRGTGRDAPQVQKERCVKPPQFTFDEEIHGKICQDARSRMASGQLPEALLPTLNDLDRFLSGYLECFHHHFPIIHLASFDLKETPSPLIFAMCSIGAQYRFSRQKAKNLFALAGTMSSYALRAGLPILSGTPKPVALWIMQTRVLLSLCGMFSGKTSVVLRTVENLGLFAIDYRLRTSLLHKCRDGHLEWEEWISRESSKRLLCGMFIVSNLISTTYGITPGFSHTHDLEFEVLDEEQLWSAQTAQEWLDLRGSNISEPRATVREAMSYVISGAMGPYERPVPEISGLTMLLVMHAVNIHMGSLRQIIGLSGVMHSEQSAVPSVHSMLLTEAFTTLSRCQETISRTREKEDQTATWTEAEGPLMFNCQGLLLMSYMRLFSDTSAFNRLALLSDNADDIAAAVRAYTEAPQQRSPSLTKVVRKAYERLLATVRIGYLLLRKTAALSWSLEHAVAGWDATLLLTKWIHTMETDSLIDPPDVDELEILDGLKQLLVETESECNGSLAAAVARFCSTTLNDVWVWGITPKMGRLLQQLALAYEERHQALQLGPFGYVVH